MNLEAFHPLIAPEVIECPIPIIDARILSAAEDFCRETLSWNGLQTIALVDGQADYVLTPPADARIESVLSVSINGRTLVATGYDTKHLSEASTEPSYYNLSTYGTLSVYPIPYQPTTSVLARVAYTPSTSAATLPDYLDRFMDVVASGAKSALMMMPNTAWSNPQLGAFYKQQFQDGILKSRISDAHGRVRGNLRVNPRQFI